MYILHFKTLIKENIKKFTVCIFTTYYILLKELLNAKEMKEMIQDFSPITFMQVYWQKMLETFGMNLEHCYILKVFNEIVFL